jgi:hypothetical protein
MGENNVKSTAVTLLKALVVVVLTGLAALGSAIGGFWGVIILMVENPHGGDNLIAFVCALAAALLAGGSVGYLFAKTLRALMCLQS